MAKLRVLWLVGHTLPGVTSGVPQRFLLGPVMFNNFISGAEVAMGFAFVTFEDDPMLRGAVDVLQNGAAVQRQLGRLEERANRSLLKFHEDKCSASGKRQSFSLIQAADCLAGWQLC